MKAGFGVLLVSALAALAAASCSKPSAGQGSAGWNPESRPYLQAAIEVGTWIRAQRAGAPEGPAWNDDAAAPGAVTPWLGTGAAGPTLFFLRLVAASGDSSWLEDARQGAAYLAASVPASPAPGDTAGMGRAGLYDGWAGVGFALTEASVALRDPALRAAAERCTRLVLASGRNDPTGVRYGAADGVLSGDAGTGLYLLYAADRLGRDEGKAAAEEIGRSLIARAARDSLGRLHWRLGEDGPDASPNFGSGTAGIAYFLATLHVATGDAAYLDAALAAGAYLTSIARADSAAFLVPLADPASAAGPPAFEVGWEHGPAGTGRLLHRLARVTGDPEWSAILAACTGGIRASGLPGAAGNRLHADLPFTADVRSGLAGAASFVLHIYDETGEDADLGYGKLLVDDLVGKGTRDARGLRWTVTPPGGAPGAAGEATPTGYLHGAAGIGLVLLQMDAVSQGMSWEFALPDDPFAADLAF